MSYTRMPYAAVVWSLGLLHIHNSKPLDVHVYYPQDTPISCFSLTIGDIRSDKIIRNALGKMRKLLLGKVIDIIQAIGVTCRTFKKTITA